MENEINIRGEYWIQDGHVDFADGDVSDTNHEMIAIQHVFSQYSDQVDSLADQYNIEHDEFDYDGVDVEAIENALSAIEEFLTTGLRNDAEEEDVPEIEPISEEAAHTLMMQHIGCNADAYNILRGGGDGRLYCMMYEGWIAVRNNNVELYGFSNDRKKEVAEGIAEIIYEDLGLTEDEYDPNEVEIYIYDQKTKRGFSTTLLEISQPFGGGGRLGIQMPADTKPPKDQYGIWNPHDQTENRPNWNKPPAKPIDKWTQAYRDKGLGFQPPWKGTSEVTSFYEWLRKKIMERK